MSEGAAERPLPAWSLPADAVDRIKLEAPWPEQVTRTWALDGATGKGIRVCVLDSGIDPKHPMVGEIERSVVLTKGEDGEPVVAEDEEGDMAGHGTACAGIIRTLAPECSISSVRVLGAGMTGSGQILLAGLRWAVENDFHVINMSLSTTKREFSDVLHELADTAYFQRTILVASAHNMPVESYPWRFSSVISVGSHEEQDSLRFYYNPDPPVEFFARGVDVELAWMGGGTIRATGNSFATPHMSAICTLVLSKHPHLTPFQLKSVLHLIADNVGGGR